MRMLIFVLWCARGTHIRCLIAQVARLIAIIFFCTHTLLMHRMQIDQIRTTAEGFFNHIRILNEMVAAIIFIFVLISESFFSVRFEFVFCSEKQLL